MLAVAFVLGLLASAAVNALKVSHKEIIDDVSESYGVDRHLIYALIKAESGFDESAVSPKEAVGLMQITKETAVWCAEKMGDATLAERVSEPEVNIKMGCFYLDYLLKRYSSSETAALAAYNAGAGNADEWLKSTEFSDDGITLKKCPFKETDGYLKKISFYKKIYKLLYG